MICNNCIFKHEIWLIIGNMYEYYETVHGHKIANTINTKQRTSCHTIIFLIVNSIVYYFQR